MLDLDIAGSRQQPTPEHLKGFIKVSTMTLGLAGIYANIQSAFRQETTYSQKTTLPLTRIGINLYIGAKVGSNSRGGSFVITDDTLKLRKQNRVVLKAQLIGCMHNAYLCFALSFRSDQFLIFLIYICPLCTLPDQSQTRNRSAFRPRCNWKPTTTNE